MNNFLSPLLIVLIVICLSILGCSKEKDANLELSNSEMSDEGKMLYAFVAKEGKRIGKKYHMSQCGIGGGAKDRIWLMSLDFQRYGSALTEEEARNLIIACLHDYLDAVNNDEKLRPFLHIYPFKAENIDMAIFNYNPTNRLEVLHPYIFVIAASRGKISYFTHEEGARFGYKSEKYESYDEAVAILQKAKTTANSQ